MQTLKSIKKNLKIAFVRVHDKFPYYYKKSRILRKKDGF